MNVKELYKVISEKVKEKPEEEAVKDFYNAIENPSVRLKQIKDDLKFFEAVKTSFLRLDDFQSRDPEEEKAYEYLMDFYTQKYPKIEMTIRKSIFYFELEVDVIEL